jgi:hypothetical protein
LPEVFSFSETLLQPGATGNVRKSIDVISEYDESFFRKGPGNRLFSKAGFPGNSERIFWHLLISDQIRDIQENGWRQAGCGSSGQRLWLPTGAAPSSTFV